MTVFFNLLLSQLNGSVVILVIILIALFFILYKTGQLGERFSNFQDRIINVEAIRDMVLTLDTKISLIYQHINPLPLVKSRSPISLTDEGKKVAGQIDADGIFENHARQLIRLVGKKEPGNAYDIQQYAFPVARTDLVDMLNEAELSRVKKTAFDRGLPIDDVLTVFGVYLRNKVLEQRGIPIADVDKYDGQSG